MNEQLLDPTACYGIYQNSPLKKLNVEVHRKSRLNKS